MLSSTFHRSLWALAFLASAGDNAVVADAAVADAAVVSTASFVDAIVVPAAISIILMAATSGHCEKNMCSSAEDSFFWGYSPLTEKRKEEECVWWAFVLE